MKEQPKKEIYASRGYTHGGKKHTYGEDNLTDCVVVLDRLLDGLSTNGPGPFAFLIW